jgi:hypothetical protein
MKATYPQYSAILDCADHIRQKHSPTLGFDIPYLKQLYTEGQTVEISYTGRPMIDETSFPAENRVRVHRELAVLGSLFNGEYRVVVDPSQYVLKSPKQVKPQKDGGSVNGGDIIHYALQKLDVKPRDGIVYNTKTGRVERRIAHPGQASEFKPIFRTFSRKYAFNTALYNDLCHDIAGPSALTTGYMLSTASTITIGTLLGYAASIPSAYVPLVENGLRTIDSAGGDLSALLGKDRWGKKLGALGLSLLPSAWVADYFVRQAGVQPTNPLYVPIAVMFQCVDSVTQGILNGVHTGRKDDPLMWGSILGAIGGGLAALAYRLVLNSTGTLPPTAFAGIDAGAVLSAVDVSIMKLFVHRAKKKWWKEAVDALCSPEELQLYTDVMKQKGDYDFAVHGVKEFREEPEVPAPEPKKGSRFSRFR